MALQLRSGAAREPTGARDLPGLLLGLLALGRVLDAEDPQDLGVDLVGEELAAGHREVDAVVRAESRRLALADRRRADEVAGVGGDEGGGVEVLAELAELGDGLALDVADRDELALEAGG